MTRQLATCLRDTWFDRVRDLNLHIGAVAAGGALVFMLFVTATFERAGEAWRELFIIVGGCVVILGVSVALTSAERRRLLAHIATEHGAQSSALERNTIAIREAAREVGWQLDSICRQLSDVVVSQRQMVTWTEQVSAWAAYAGGELARLGGSVSELERAAGGPLPPSMTAVQQQLGMLPQILQTVEELKRAEAKRRARHRPRHRANPAASGADAPRASVTQMPHGKAFQLGREVERRLWQRQGHSSARRW